MTEKGPSTLNPSGGIHPTAVIHPTAKIAEGVEIGPYAVIGPDVELGAGTWVGPHAIVEYATVGKGCKIHPHAFVGTPPQDLKYKGEKTRAVVGDNTVIRECVTFNRGTSASGETVVGKNCLLMAYVHIAHDCRVGDNVIIANNGTLSLDGEKGHEARVHTVEHVLSALYALGIDNLLVEVNANEPPVADGSAMPFIDVLKKAGLKAQDKPRSYFRPDPVEYKAGETEYRVEPADELELETTIDFKHPLVQKQTLVFRLNTENYLREIARARTFCFDYEVEGLKRQGLARGGSLDNAVVVGMDKIHNKEKSLRYPDEFVRHKTLDLLGDLYLLGMPLKAKIFATRVGHGHNVNLVKQLAAQMDAVASR